jgi:hypothetical protein
MRRTIVFSSALALALMGYAGQASAQDSEDEEEEIVVTKRKKKKVEAEGEGKVQVIVINDDEEDGPRRKKRRRLDAIDGEKPPPGYHTETTTYKGIWGGGIGMLGGGYLLTLISGAVADAVEGYEDGKFTYYSLIPVAGAFVSAGHSEIEGPGKMPFIIFGLIQAGGLGMIIGGASAKKEVWVSDDAMVDPEVFVGPGMLGIRQRF